MLIKHTLAIILMLIQNLSIGHTFFNSFSRGKTHISLNNSHTTCSRNMPCKVAICLWERIPTITEEKCTFLEYNCSCAAGDICALTSDLIPGKQILTFQYKCRNPADVFRNSRYNL